MQHYVHKKSHSIYKFITEAVSEADRESLVVYESVETGVVWVRPRSEFFEKFEKIPVDEGIRSLEGAKKLIVDLHGAFPKAREMIERRSVTLTGAQLLAAAEFLIPDCITVAKPDGKFGIDTVTDELMSTVVIEWCEAGVDAQDGESMPAGYYAWMADYPEEGYIPLDAAMTGAQPKGGA